MSGYADAASPGRPGPFPNGFDDWRGFRRRFGPPLPAAILIVVAAFCLFHPLGLALLAFFLWRAARGRGGCGFRAKGFHHRAGRAAFRNAAFEERRREVLKELDEEADAFDAFERKRREAEDRAAFERFLAERAAQKRDDSPK